MDCLKTAAFLYLFGVILWILGAVLFTSRNHVTYKDHSPTAVRRRGFMATGLMVVGASLLVTAWFDYSYCADGVPPAQRPALFPLLQISVFLCVLSFGRLYEYFLSLRNVRLIETMPTSKCRSVAMGLVEVAGRAAGDETVTSAAGLPVFYARACVERGIPVRGGVQWILVTDELHSTPFFLEDSTGRVRVDPTGAELRADTVISYSGETGLLTGPAVGSRIRAAGLTLEQIQGRLESYYREVMASGSLPMQMPRRLKQLPGTQAVMRVREIILGPGDPVYVLGTAAEHPGESESDRVVIRKGKHHPWFVIASGSQKQILSELNQTSAVVLLSGVSFGVVGLLMLAWALRWI